MALSTITPLPDYPDPDSADFEDNIGPWAAGQGVTTADWNVVIGEINGGALPLMGGTISDPTTFTSTLTSTRGANDLFSLYRTDANASTLAGVVFRHLGAADDCLRVMEQDNAGTVGSALGRFDPAGTSSPSTLTFQTREKADARFEPISSDATLKENITDMPDVGAIIDALQPRNFTWIENADDQKPTGTQYGLIAQEVGAVFPSGCVAADEGKFGISQSNLIGLLIREIQSLRARVTALEP